MEYNRDPNLAVTHASNEPSCFVGLIFSFYLLLVLVLVFLTLPGDLFYRLSEINTEGTSGYWRLIAPQKIIINAFSTTPFGVPFGQVENFVTSLGLVHGNTIGSSIDNGMALLIFYFGVFGVGFLIYILFQIVKFTLLGNYKKLMFWVYAFMSLQFTGGVFLPEFTLLLVFLIYSYRLTNLNVIGDK